MEKFLKFLRLGFLIDLLMTISIGSQLKKMAFIVLSGWAITGFSQSGVPKTGELQEVLVKFPTIKEFLVNASYDGKVKTQDALAAYRFIDTVANEPVYIAWSKTGIQQSLQLPKGTYWVMDTAQVPVDKPFRYNNIQVSAAPVFILQAAPESPIIKTVKVDGQPFVPFASDGDLWLSTWADDNNIYSGWGDGRGPLNDQQPISWVDCGIVKLTGELPDLKAETRYREDETPPLAINDKPSSLIYLDSLLYGQFHSPLGDARIGYLSVSKDYGINWKRIGYFGEDEKPSESASPWLRKNHSPFRCMFLINMGQNYQLNTDGFVYALGIGTEWHWMGQRVFLTRVKKENIAKYDQYEYFAGYSKKDAPKWTTQQSMAKPVKGPNTFGQGSAIYHPGIKRYLFMTDFDVFDAPHPWGPWTYAGSWTTWKTRPGVREWQGGYQPGILSKGIGPDSFWFTVSGQNARPLITYSYNLGKMIMTLK
ncbi:MAG TPA: hypothetical protein DCL77_18580 [Prolixibacteraceae bacterium]|jgi:hypothetical protein|nr:hypothetical protein [Prolixibacteraceae bacterium]